MGNGKWCGGCCQSGHGVVATTFLMIFLAELGDKTQLAVITLTSKHQNPLSVFAGAAVALVLVTLIGVIFGIVGGVWPFLKSMRQPMVRAPPPREWQVER